MGGPFGLGGGLKGASDEQPRGIELRHFVTFHGGLEGQYEGGGFVPLTVGADGFSGAVKGVVQPGSDLADVFVQSDGFLA